MVYLAVNLVLLLLPLGVVAGVAGWIGYLLGRAHAHDPAGQWHTRPPVSLRTRRFVIGGTLVVLSLYLLDLVLGGGDSINPDLPQALVAALAVVTTVVGFNHLVMGIRTQQR